MAVAVAPYSPDRGSNCRPKSLPSSALPFGHCLVCSERSPHCLGRVCHRQKTATVCCCLTDCWPGYGTDWLTINLSSRCTAEDNRIFFSPNTWQMMTFLNPLDALIPKIPFSFFADLWVRVTSKARGSVSVGLWGSCQLSLSRATPPPPPRQFKPVQPRPCDRESQVPSTTTTTTSSSSSSSSSSFSPLCTPWPATPIAHCKGCNPL